VVATYTGSDENPQGGSSSLMILYQLLRGRKETLTFFICKGEPVVFHTDANGRQLVKRVLNQRSYNFTDGDKEPVASNYYPITSGMS
jgi:hypothetical protein